MNTTMRKTVGVMPFRPILSGPAGAATAAELPPIFQNEFVELLGVQVSMDSWESNAERGYYRAKAERLLSFYRSDVEELRRAQTDLEYWQELRWEDVFDPTDVLRGVSYDKERVQTSNISDEPYQIYVAAETRLEQNQRDRENIERTISICKERVEMDVSLLNLLRGNTKKVAELLWYDEQELTWDAIAEQLYIGRASVQRERDRAIEAVAMFIKRTDYRKVRMWFM